MSGSRSEARTTVENLERLPGLAVRRMVPERGEFGAHVNAKVVQDTRQRGSARPPGPQNEHEWKSAGRRTARASLLLLHQMFKNRFQPARKTGQIEQRRAITRRGELLL